MKKLIILSVLIISGCCTSYSDSYYYIDYLIINLRIDDDAEYHINYKSINGMIYSESDISSIKVVAKNIQYPILKKRVHKHCDCFNNVSESIEAPFRDSWIIEIPNNYKIETFDD